MVGAIESMRPNLYQYSDKPDVVDWQFVPDKRVLVYISLPTVHLIRLSGGNNYFLQNTACLQEFDTAT